MNETFGQRLSRIRKEKGMTQEDIAKRIVISPQAVSKWENDLSSPDILVLSSLADILGVSVDELLGRESSESINNSNEHNEHASEVVDDKETVEEDETLASDKDNGGPFISINDDGIHIKSKKGKSVEINDDGVFVDGERKTAKKKAKDSMKKESKKWITGSTLFGLAIIGYILMGLLWKDDAMGWKCGWTLFLFAICIQSFIEAIRKRKFTSFAYPIFITATYCLLGFLGSHYNFPNWGFFWFLFLTIPAYYMIFAPIDAKIHFSKYIEEPHADEPDERSLDDDDEDDD